MQEEAFHWLKSRSAGVFVHPTSLPNDFGIGTFGKEVKDLIHFMKEAGLSKWQMCPLNPPGYGNSPYSSYSAFAGNPMLIDTQQLVEAELLEAPEHAKLNELPHEQVDYETLYPLKSELLQKAFERFQKNKAKRVLDYPDYATFKKRHEQWLPSYATFMALKDRNDGKPWQEWDDPDLRNFEKALQKNTLMQGISEACESYQFSQYLFFSQWERVRAWAHEAGIEIVGDIPIFVSFDSADLWANKHYFQVNDQGNPSHVAGVPPDYFSETGQRWGNPLYDWEALEKEGFAWWMQRLKQTFELYDIVRLDHFRGFYNYWRIPAESDDAREGEWQPGPAYGFFEQIHKDLPGAKLIAEDLGDQMEEVFAFRKEIGLPGMAILQFAFGGDNTNPYLPANIEENTVVYTGTHDNNTTRGWFEHASYDERKHARDVLGSDGREIAYDFIRCAYRSKGNMTIIPMQDFMDMPDRARFNTPGLPTGNWRWRYPASELNRLLGPTTHYLSKLAESTGRSPDK